MARPKTLLKAVTAGRTRQVRLLLDLGANTEDYDDCGQTPLIRAVFLDQDRNRDKIMRMLLKKGAKVSSTDVVGRNALSWACLYGRDSDVSLLLEYVDVDMDYNKMDINGQTALFHAVSSGNAATVKLIVQAVRKYELAVEIADFNGVTPLMHATRLGHDICASILILEGCAKSGFGHVCPENYARNEKWAVSSLRETSKVKCNKAKYRRSHFPPIADDIPSIGRQRVKPGRKQDSDQDVMSSDEEFFETQSQHDNIKGAIHPRDTIPEIPPAQKHVKNTPVINCLQIAPRCNIPPSILAFPASTNRGNVSSDEDSDEDSVASTVVDRKLKPSHVKLSSIYGMYQEQLCTSYRQTAVKVEPLEPPRPAISADDMSEGEQSTPGRGRKECESKKWMHLRKSLRLASVFKGALKNERQAAGTTDIRKPAALPTIPGDKKVQLVQALPNVLSQTPVKKAYNTEKNCSYSEI